MHDTKRKIKEEIRKIEQKGINSSNAQYLAALTKSLKDLEEIEYFDVAEEAMLRGEHTFRDYAQSQMMDGSGMHGDMMRERQMPMHMRNRSPYSGNDSMGFTDNSYNGNDTYSRFEDARRKYHMQRNPRTRSEMMSAFDRHMEENPHMAESYENHDDEEIRDAARRYRRRR